MSTVYEGTVLTNKDYSTFKPVDSFQQAYHIGTQARAHVHRMPPPGVGVFKKITESREPHKQTHSCFAFLAIEPLFLFSCILLAGPARTNRNVLDFPSD
jgi:hypothetical protein